VNPLPLKWRISLLLSLVLLAVISTISIVAYLKVERSLVDNIDQTIRAMADAIRVELNESKGKNELETEVRAITGSTKYGRSIRYRVWRHDQQADLTASDPPDSKYGLWLRALPRDSAPEVGRPAFFDVGERREGFRAIWMHCATTQGHVNVVVAQPTHQVFQEMQRFLRMLLILGASMVAGSAVVGILIVLWAIRPIGRSAERLRRITRMDLGSEDLHDIRVPYELRPFLNAVADMLARMDKVFQQQERFTANASHELRTPLALAKSTLQATRSRDRDLQEYRTAIDETLKDLDRMDRLINQMLVLARMDETDGMSQVTDLSLDGLLLELAETFHVRASQAGGNVVCGNLAPTRVRGNEGQLVQLFSNLLDNAIKHGPPGGTVRVTLEHADRACAVCVHDEGGNIPAEALPHLFGRFYRVDSSRNRATGGAGLGLTIAHEITSRHGGKIEISSSQAEGTRVTVRLPRLSE
jgi:two-component system heavy metal sensor histidine kinase CusS